MRLIWHIVALWSAAASAVAADAPVERSLRFDGLDRSYVLYAPAEVGERETALVVVLHGSGGSGMNILEQGRWIEKARAAGFVLVAPDGTTAHDDRPARFLGNPRSWNSGPSTGSPAQLRDIDDVGFIRAVIEDVRRTHRIDARRIYATGFSNGAAMAFRVGAELSDVVAAVAPVSNALLVPVERLQKPVSLLMIWGTRDKLNPPGGGEVTRGGRTYVRPSAEASWRRWSELLACMGEPTLDQSKPKVTARSYARCAGEAEATLVTVEGLGHQWPGGQVVLRAVAGPGSDALDATDLIWRFFEKSAR